MRPQTVTFGIAWGLMLLALVPGHVEGQRWYGGDDYTEFNVGYDGRFTFVRLSFTTPVNEWNFRRRRGPDLKWDHDWPIAETNLMKLLRELTDVTPFMEGSNILAADDPELFKYPIAYVSEPGFWTLTEEETVALREYLLKGGFLIFDDFAGPYEWANFEHRMLSVLPEARLVRLNQADQIFHSFFEIDSLDHVHPYRGVQAEFWGIFEENDPGKRLMVIVNYNNDIGDYWEFSDMGWYPIDLSNEAYKLGINYVVYAMTH
jgi:hypothetical protein